MTWIEICTSATDEGLDWICTALSALAPAAPETASPEIQISSSADSNWQFQVQIYLKQPAPPGSLAQIQAALRPMQRTRLISPPATYLTDQKPDPQPLQQQFGRFVLSPTHPLAPDQIPLHLTPSLVFGQGAHPATRLALQLIERHVSDGMQSLDLGTGTGILGLAMAKLGATVLALDNEPAAVAAASATMRLNQVEAQVTVKRGSLGQGSELGHWLGNQLGQGLSSDLDATPAVPPAAQFDLIAANILARIHLALVQDYRLALRPNGILITAGFTTELAAEVESALAEAGFERLEAVQLNEWVALAHRLSASALPMFGGFA